MSKDYYEMDIKMEATLDVPPKRVGTLEVKASQLMNPGRKIVALDVDGILANFYLAMCKKFNMPYVMLNDWSVPWIFENFREIRYDKKFWETLPILSPPESITFEFDFYVTALPSQMKAARERWLATNGFPDRPVIVSRDKLKTCKENNIDILVDDKPKNLVSLIGSQTNPVRFLPNYFKAENVAQSMPIIKHLDELNQFL